MRDYGKVYTAFWTSEDARGFSEDARMLALYLMTCPHGNMIGCFRLPNAYAADDLKWGIERVSKGFAELHRNGFAYRCDRSFWAVIHKHLKWNKLENPNVGKAAGKLFDSISPPHDVKIMLVKAIREFGQFFPNDRLEAFDTLSKGLTAPVETLSKPVTIAVTVTEAVTGPVTIPASPEKEYPDAFDATWKLYPTRPGASKKEAFKAWSARLKAGADAFAMESGAARYAAYVAAMQTEPQYIKQASSFFGPGDHYKADWTVPPQQARLAQPQSRHSGFETIDYSEGIEDGRIL